MADPDTPDPKSPPPSFSPLPRSPPLKHDSTIPYGRLPAHPHHAPSSCFSAFQYSPSPYYAHASSELSIFSFCLHPQNRILLTCTPALGLPSDFRKSPPIPEG